MGVNLQSLTINMYLYFSFNPFNILIFLSAAIIALFTTVNYFNVEDT
jgi:hypothetical protein